MSIKIIIVALVAVLSGIFFWQTTNRFLYPSKAALSTTPTPLPFIVPNTTPGAVAPTTAGTNTNPAVPTTAVCNKSKGDFNCDGQITGLDFEVWRTEFVGGRTTVTADANGDGVVSGLDFEIWRKTMFP